MEPVDFRCGIDGLAQLCRAKLEEEPFSGAVFVFRNRRQTAVKLITYDGQGFWLCYKRLSKGRFSWWPTSTEGGTREMEAHELFILLRGGNPEAVRGVPIWRRVGPASAP